MSIPTKRGKLLRVQVIVFLFSVIALLLVGLIDAEVLRRPGGKLDEHQWWIYSSLGLAFLSLYWGARPVSKAVYARPVDIKNALTFEACHLAFWGSLVGIVMITMFYLLPGNRTFSNIYCLASALATCMYVMVSFSVAVVLSKVRKRELRLIQLTPILVVAYVISAFSWGAILYDLVAVHAVLVVKTPPTSFLDSLFSSVVSGRGPDVTKASVFVWAIIIIGLLTLWAYRFLILGCVKQIVDTYLKDQAKESRDTSNETEERLP